jgi:O-antigen/teichoic acid export membrane protein
MALFRFKGVSVQAALMATAMCSAVIIILTVRRGLAIISRWRTGPNAAPHFAKYALTVWAGNLTNVGLSLYSSVFLLGILVTDISQVGFYNAAVLPIGRLWTVMAAGMGTVMLPTLAEIGARHGAPGLARAWRAYVNVFVLVLLPTYGFVLVYATPLARFFFGEAYLPVSGLMRVYLALVLPGTFFVGTATINLFYATRRQGLVLLTSTIGGLLDIALLLLLIPKLNALGAILADGLSGLATSLLLFVLLKHRLPMLSYPIGFVLKIAGATFGAFTTAYWLVPPRSPATAAISMMLGAILFISLSRALKPLIHEDLPLKQFGPRLGQIAQWFGAPCGTYPV